MADEPPTSEGSAPTPVPQTAPASPAPQTDAASGPDADAAAQSDSTPGVQVGAPGSAGSSGAVAPEPSRPLVVRIMLIIAALVIFAGVTVAITFGLQALNRARNAEAHLSAALRLLDSAEDGLTTVDEAVRAEITSEIATQSTEAIPLAEKARADALAASALVEEAMPDLKEDRRPLAEAVKESADARAEMMAEAPTVLQADIKAATAMVPADQSVVEIKAAEDLVAKAVVAFNKHTKAGVRQSTVLSTEAEGHLNTAKSLLATATASFPEADFSAFTAYIDAKLGLIALSKEIDSLWLAGKIDASNKKLDAYNKRDAEVLAMAKALPASVRDPIANAYDALTAEASDRYFEARERARAAGERVSDLKQQEETD